MRPSSWIKAVTIVIALHTQCLHAQKIGWVAVTAETDASFRALSVVDDSIAWIAGSKGWVGRTDNGGRDWKFSQVKGFETFDFRSLYAFDNRKAVIANAGAPANILVTEDGGQSWKVVYTNTDTAAFFDGMDFWDEKHGLVYGDPINGKMLLLRTKDGGQSWRALAEENRPSLSHGEASFAASGTNIRCFGGQKVVIATGGITSRLWLSENAGSQWKPISPPVLHGEPSTGIFSFSGFRNGRGVIVGGDYLRDTLSKDHVFYTRDGGKTWQSPAVPTRGYRECVEYLNETTLIATGPGGTDLSEDGGVNWVPVSNEKLFHVVRKARKGNLIIIAGGQGKISVLKFATYGH